MKRTTSPRPRRTPLRGRDQAIAHTLQEIGEEKAHAFYLLAKVAGFVDAVTIGNEDHAVEGPCGDAGCWVCELRVPAARSVRLAVERAVGLGLFAEEPPAGADDPPALEPTPLFWRLARAMSTPDETFALLSMLGVTAEPPPGSFPHS